MDDLLSEFLTEANESISVLDVELVKLEQNPNDPELLGNIFRLVHTIKGTCGFLGLPRLESVAHAAENVLGKVRDGELKVSHATSARKSSSRLPRRFPARPPARSTRARNPPWPVRASASTSISSRI